MAYDKVIRARVAAQFKKRKAERQREMFQRREEVYAVCGEVREIENALSQSAFLAYRDILNGADSGEVAQKLAKLGREAAVRKQQLLSAGGFTPDYLDENFDCPKCKDEGFVGSEMCDCYRRALICEAYRVSNLSALSGQTFDKFNRNFYAKEPDPDGVSPYEAMGSILRQAKQFAGGFDQTDQSLLFYGSSGLGKTFLSSCIANQLIANGKTVLYQSSGSLFSILEHLRFNRSVSDQERYIAASADTADLLIIDDLGTETINDYTLGELFRIVNTRLLEHKKTIISTNFSMGDLRQMYSERLISRIIGNYALLHFRGKDIRLQKKYLNI